MKSKGFYIWLYLIIIIVIANSSLLAQRDNNFELIISSDYGAGTEYTHEATLALTGWGWTFGDNNFGWPSTSGASLYVSDDADVEIGFDSPSSTGSNWPDMVWGYYLLTYVCSDGYSGAEYIDFRDHGFTRTYGNDTYIRYFHEDRRIKWSDDEYSWELMSSPEKPWVLWGVSQERDSLRVRVACSYNKPGGKIRWGPTSWINQPFSYWVGWTTDKAIAARDSFYSYGYKRRFVEWNDAEQDTNRGKEVFGNYESTTNDSLFEFIALYSTEIPTPGSFDVDLYGDNPYLSWTTVTGDSIDGYLIDRNFNGSGFSHVTTIGSSSTSNWTDTDIEYDKDGYSIQYRMYTRDLRGDSSAVTATQGTTGYLLFKKRSISG